MIEIRFATGGRISLLGHQIRANVQRMLGVRQLLSSSPLNLHLMQRSTSKFCMRFHRMVQLQGNFYLYL
jgi:hypothetical protein